MTELALDSVVLGEQLPLAAEAVLWTRARRLAKFLLRPNRRVRWGNLRRQQPLSPYYGYDRGNPVDRHYIERFLAARAGDIRGRVLEVRDPRYTRAFGGDRVVSSDVVDVDETNEEATVIADLAKPGSLPAGVFDCAIVTQTLQYVSRPVVAVENLFQALAPGGVVMISVPCAARIDPDNPATDLWRMTPRGLGELIRRGGTWDDVDVRQFGNVLTSVAFLYGLAADELADRELAEHDEDFPLVACAWARKPG